MPMVTCAHCEASWYLDATELAPREMELTCELCGETSVVDGLHLLQEGAEALELDWGDRPTPPREATPAPTPPPAAASRLEVPTIAERTSPDDDSFVLEVRPLDVAGLTARALLAICAVVESLAAFLAFLHAPATVLPSLYWVTPERVALLVGTGLAFSAWAALSHQALAHSAGEHPSTASSRVLPYLLAIAVVASPCLAIWYAACLHATEHLRFASRADQSPRCATAAAVLALAFRFLRWTHERIQLQRMLAIYSPQLPEPQGDPEPALPQGPALGERPVAFPAQPGPLAATAPLPCPSCATVEARPRCSRCGSARQVRGATILQVLAAKPHARTYLAQAPGGDRFVLKELAFALAPDAAAIAAFEREAALLRQLSHPRIPRFLASFCEGEGAETRFYLAQEFVPGHSLAAELESHRYSEPEVVDLLHQALRVLVYLHGLSPPVLHRDLKPANLIRRTDGTLALVDFGAAREGGSPGATLVGTFGYMPPEQLAGQVDSTCDLYALGMTALHLLTRRAPWELFADDPDRFPEGLNISAGLRRFLEKLTAQRRSQRIPSARKALAMLAALDDRAPSFRRWLAPAAAALAALLALAGARHSGAPPPTAPAGVSAAAASPTDREAPLERRALR